MSSLNKLVIDQKAFLVNKERFEEDLGGVGLARGCDGKCSFSNKYWRLIVCVVIGVTCNRCWRYKQRRLILKILPTFLDSAGSNARVAFPLITVYIQRNSPELLRFAFGLSHFGLTLQNGQTNQKRRCS